jgi:hypothetical protein
MYFENIDIQGALEDFSLDGTTFPYNGFVVRLYNLCRSLGFESGKILPSRAFCSDETQGYPNILIAKQFGTFPFNHGRVGGIVATDRHGPHAHHGKDLVIIHASHVGYEPENDSFGSYHRRHTEHFEMTPTCGKIESVLRWYSKQYTFAKENIFLHRHNQDFLVTIDNQTLAENTNEGLFLYLDKIVAIGHHGGFRPRKSYSTSKCYVASAEFRKLLGDSAWPNKGREPIGERLLPELIGFKRHISGDPETHGLLEENMIIPMPWIVSSTFPLLTAARANIQCEFDRTYRTILNSNAYVGKRLLFISGLNVDISPPQDQVFPLTTFVPWAAYIQDQHGKSSVLEQRDIVDRLLEQHEHNPDEVDLEVAIQHMKDAEEIKIKIL